MHKTFNFGIDIDGTVTCPTTFIPHLNQSFNVNLTIEDIKQYNLAKALNITDEAFAQWLRDNESEIYKNPPLASNAKDILSNWQHHQLIYISARHSRYETITNNWFTKLGLPYHQIHCTGDHNKIEPVLNNNIDVFFEDNFNNACQISEECQIPVVLFDTPYNKGTLPDLVSRVSGWPEAKLHVDNWIKQAIY
jgi:uncharacterized HAD superfamily protein